VKEQLFANIKTNFKFLFRNLLLLLIIIIFVITILQNLLMSSFMHQSNTNRFDTIQSIVSIMQGFSGVLVISIGVLIVFSHLRGRSLKLIFTKPCLPETWLLSLFLTIIISAAVLYFFSFLVASCLFIVWKIPYQWGLLYLTAREMLTACATSLTLLMLCLIVHPILAVFVLLTFQERSFYFLVTQLEALLRTTSSANSFYLSLAKQLAYAIYMILPADLFGTASQKINSSWIMTGKDTLHLGIIFVYTVVLGTLLFFLSLILLRKKRLL
jgi:hypothetical protein